MNILGVSAFYHDSAACLVSDGTIVAAAEEERFTRKKHDSSFPVHAIEYCLREGEIRSGQVDLVVYYEKPLTRFLRILRTHLEAAPGSWRSFVTSIPPWVHTKLWVSYWIEKTLVELGYGPPGRIGYAEHHQAHAASAFFPSPYSRAAVLTMDGVGEWATTSISVGEENRVDMLSEIHFPHSLGLLYSAFTYFTGFKVNSGEYKLMGLAPYGRPVYADAIRGHLIEVRPDGSFKLNMKYFDFLGGLRMTNDRFAALFGGPPRTPEGRITQREADLAASVQQVLEEIVIRLAKTAMSRTGSRNLCLAGGVALNCVANGRLLRDGIVDGIWVQPAAGDAGGALGAALHAWYQIQGHSRTINGDDDMKGSLLGPAYDDRDVGAFLDGNDYPCRKLENDDWAEAVARLVANSKVVGLFQGRMEFGPRALGNRSIIGDPRSPEMQSVMNLKIKFRESFRPFAPAVLRESLEDYFDLDRESPYMLLVAPVRPELRCDEDADENGFDLTRKVRQVRSIIPAVTHVDYSARIQTVDQKRNPRFYALLKSFESLTGCGVIVNTSFNVRGEPLVCSPEDAYRCFMRTEMDYLVIGSYLLDKKEQPPYHSPDLDSINPD